MIQLYPHQTTFVQEARNALRNNRSIILRAPTGMGKTICAAHIVDAGLAKSSNIIFTVHRRELIKQTMDAFDTCGIPYGVISAGFKYDPFKSVQIASIDTLKKRLELIPEPDLMIIDECHHCASSGWASVVSHYDKCKILGLTATPWRLDGRGLKDFFGAIVHGPEAQWLIDNKFLSPFRAFAPSAPDLSNVHTKMGDYDIHEIEEQMDTPKLIGDAVEHYKKICNGARAVAFTTTINHSLHVAECFNQEGIPSAHIDGSMNSGARDESINKFRNGEIKVLTNCNIVSEGFDVPQMDAAILLRPTKSLSLYLQQVGRALRYVEGKTAIILDHAGNIMEHGLPTDSFDWSLEGRKKNSRVKKDEVKVRTCPTCYCAHEAKLRICPQCGHTYVVERAQIEQVDGKLVEINQEDWRARMPYKKVLARSRTEEDLYAVAKARGYKNAWVHKILQQRRMKGAR